MKHFKLLSCETTSTNFYFDHLLATDSHRRTPLQSLALNPNAGHKPYAVMAFFNFLIKCADKRPSLSDKILTLISNNHDCDMNVGQILLHKNVKAVDRLISLIEKLKWHISKKLLREFFVSSKNDSASFIELSIDGFDLLRLITLNILDEKDYLLLQNKRYELVEFMCSQIQAHPKVYLNFCYALFDKDMTLGKYFNATEIDEDILKNIKSKLVSHLASLNFSQNMNEITDRHQLIAFILNPSNQLFFHLSVAEFIEIEQKRCASVLVEVNASIKDHIRKYLTFAESDSRHLKKMVEDAALYILNSKETDNIKLTLFDTIVGEKKLGLKLIDFLTLYSKNNRLKERVIDFLRAQSNRDNTLIEKLNDSIPQINDFPTLMIVSEDSGSSSAKNAPPKTISTSPFALTSPSAAPQSTEVPSSTVASKIKNLFGW